VAADPPVAAGLLGQIDGVGFSEVLVVEFG
jgi:hypothetical protein